MGCVKSAALKIVGVALTLMNMIGEHFDDKEM